MGACQSSVALWGTVGAGADVDCQFRCRLDELAPGAPQWFEIDDETESSAIGPIVAGYLDTAVRARGAVTSAGELARRISRDLRRCRDAVTRGAFLSREGVPLRHSNPLSWIRPGR